MKASRAAIKTAKAVKAVEERLSPVEVRLVAIDERLARVETVLQQLVEAVSVERPSTAAEALGKPGARKARTSRKRGGGA